MGRNSVFEERAAAYDEWFEAHAAAFASELDAIRDLLPRRGKGIDIGTGTGRFASALGIEYGLEPADAMRAIAEMRGIKVASGVAERMPFDTASFDYATMVTTVCFLDDIGAALNEVHRILKPGGALVVGLIDRATTLGMEYEQRKADSDFYRDARFYSTTEIKNEMKRAGFGDFVFRQTLLRDPDRMELPDPVVEGHGDGAFVVIKGLKRR